MKKYLLPSVLISCCLLMLSACTPEPKKETLPPTEEKPMEQIPAAEVLGSTVARHLRFQSQTELETVLDEPDQLLNYISAVSGSFRQQIGKIPTEEKQRGAVFVALKSDGSSKLWYVFNERPASDALKGATRKGMNAVKPIQMKQGTIVFGVALALWGYKETPDEEHEVIIPSEWTDAGKKLGGDHPASELALAAWETGY